MKFHSEPVEEHVEVPLADQGALEALVEEAGSRRPRASDEEVGPNQCFVVSVRRPRETLHPEAQLAEIVGLVEAQGDAIVGTTTYELSRPDARTLLGRGTAQRIGEEARRAGANLLVLDAELSPSQTRNLEDATGLPVSDREAVILNVFERNATTRRAKVQVEIAHLEYLRPRIRGIGLNMDQQAGGILGGRGPGETASELMARRMDSRLAQLRANLRQIQTSDAASRKQRVRCDRIVLVGYTNAGKTSLMNALTHAGLSARNRPFETLQTTSRCLTRHGGEVLISDTVGFIRRLPERLFESFASTLAEVAEASLLLLVVDASDPELELHLETTERVLHKLEAEDVPRFVIFNKADRLPERPSEEQLNDWSRGWPYRLLSAHSEAEVGELREAVLSQVRSTHQHKTLFVPYTATEASQRIYRSCRVLKAEALEGGVRYEIEGDPEQIARVEKILNRSEQ